MEPPGHPILPTQIFIESLPANTLSEAILLAFLNRPITNVNNIQPFYDSTESDEESSLRS